MATTVVATSSFIGIRLFYVYSTSGRVVARFNFRGKKATKKVSKPNSDRPLWYPGVVAPDWFDGSLIVLVIGYIEFQRNAELDPEKKLYPDEKYFDPLGLASDPKKKATLQLVEIKHVHLAMVAFLGYAV
ncbi:hypothetical protein PVK06_012553 [Gossypium arboreum]|uniref:Chlorophyll a-b binding protein, chloroplastic n=1 Tax=Gossypium arboreum TaxID=29729 RepID=A0ABR0QCS5_GOSAR|nr:hypothetical protein PVK06_012553 [Gossypium arboreum]